MTSASVLGPAISHCLEHFTQTPGNCSALGPVSASHWSKQISTIKSRFQQKNVGAKSSFLTSPTQIRRAFPVEALGSSSNENETLDTEQVQTANTVTTGTKEPVEISPILIGSSQITIQDPVPEIVAAVVEPQVAGSGEGKGEAGEAFVEVISKKEVRRRKRLRLKKLQKEDKGTAPWGWGAKHGEEKYGAEELKLWLAIHGLPKQKLDLQGVREGGRGLVATESISKGEEILFIPESVLITVDTVYNCPKIGQVMSSNKVPDWPALATFLVAEGATGEGSFWWSYINSLPSTPGCILQWSVEEIDELLKGSSVVSKSLEYIADVNDTFRDMDAQIFSQNRTLFPAEVFTLQTFKWAFAVLFSRLVRLGALGGKVALVPWGDMLNHRCEVQAYLDYDKGRKAIVLKSDRSYSIGQQVYASYGPRPNGELLLAYGVMPATRNPHDAVMVTVGMNSADPEREKKEEILASSNLGSPMAFPLRMDGIPSQLSAFAAFATSAPSTSHEQLLKLAAAIGDGAESGAATSSSGWKAPSFFPFSQEKDERSVDEEIAARELILAACEVALAGYTTTLEDDEAEIADVEEEYLEDDGEFKVRIKAAAALRASEKRILFRTVFVLRGEIRELKAEAASKSGKTKIDLGNNFGGETKGFLNSLVAKIVQPPR